MKKVFTIFSITCFLGFTIVSCEKDRNKNAPEYNVGSDMALLKINFVSQYTANPSVQLKLNDVRISNLLTARTPFPGGGFNTGGGSSNDYLAVSPGQQSLKVSIPNKGTSNDSVILYTTDLTLAAGKNYSAHITDTGANTKLVLLEDDISQPASGRSKYRFVHLMPNVPSVDLYYGNDPVVTNLAYLASSPYFEMPIPTTSLAWTIRATGSSTVIASYGPTSNTHLNRRVYTIFSSGYLGVTPLTTSTRRPFLSFYLNY